jgi:uncharacterized coiled-coil protein SlyX
MNEIRHLHAHIAELERARRYNQAQLRVMVERQLADITAAEQAPTPPVPAPPPGVTVPAEPRVSQPVRVGQE